MGTPTILQSGFRPFFLAAAVGAALLAPAWGLAWMGVLTASSPVPMVHWHAHEMLVGVVGAVLAGFLLTAGSAWTRSVTARGLPLGALALAWLIGRIMLAVDLGLPAWLVAVPDAVWLLGTAVAIGRPMVLTRNWRNLGFPALMAGLAVCHAIIVLSPSHGPWAWTIALDLVLVALVIVSGRILPMFTRNGLGDSRIGRWPWVDRAANVAVISLVGASVLDTPTARGVVALILGVLLVVRTIPIRPWLTLRRPLIWVLHLGILWLAFGLFLLAGSLLELGVPRSAAIHALTVGAAGTLCLGMMARVSRGHTARPLYAGVLTTVAFVTLVAAAVARVWAGWTGGGPIMMMVAASLFGLAFLVWLPEGLRMLLSPRLDGRPG